MLAMMDDMTPATVFESVVGAACGDKVLEINQNCAETREKNNQCTLPVVRPVEVSW